MKLLFPDDYHLIANTCSLIDHEPFNAFSRQLRWFWAYNFTWYRKHLFELDEEP